MSTKRHYIYEITILTSGKRYTGQTVNPKSRWYAHKKSAQSENPGQIIQKSMKKYGIENCSFTIIASGILPCTCEPGKPGSCQDDINEIETHIVSQNETHISTGKGYNVSNGGSTAPKTPEWIAMMKEKMKEAFANDPERSERLWGAAKQWREERVAQGLPATVGGHTKGSPELEKLLEAAHKAVRGRKQPQEEKDKRSAALLAHYEIHPSKNIGRKPSPEEMEKRLAGQRATFDDPNYVSPHKGKHHSPTTEFKPGLVPWNTGTIGVIKPNSGSFKPGQSVSPATQFKPGTNWNAHNRKLSERDEIDIRTKYANGQSKRSLAREYKIDRTCITRVVKNNPDDK